MKRLLLELGGKSACIVLDDADLDAAVTGVGSPCMTRCACSASARTGRAKPRDSSTVISSAATAASRSRAWTSVAPIGSSTRMHTSRARSVPPAATRVT